MEITIPVETVAAIVGATAGTIAGAFTLIAFIIALPTLFYIARQIVALMPKSKR